MSIVTINHSDTIRRFEQMLSKDSEFRILRLWGGPKLGKSHLLTKIFPKIAQVHNTPCAIVDLREKTKTIAEILYFISMKFGGADFFRSFDAAYQDWITSSGKVEITGLKATFANVLINVKPENGVKEDFPTHLTIQFIEDLRKLDGTRLLIFDTVNDADDTTLKWLMNTFLMLLEPLPHVRVVVAGRSVPEVTGNCVLICDNYELRKVMEKEEYIKYCQDLNLPKLTGENIEIIAKISEFTPGTFIESLSTLAKYP